MKLKKRKKHISVCIEIGCPIEIETVIRLMNFLHNSFVAVVVWQKREENRCENYVVRLASCCNENQRNKTNLHQSAFVIGCSNQNWDCNQDEGFFLCTPIFSH